jgi:hypothetical protein
MVTAQKYLADVSARLASVERGIRQIRDYLEDNRWGQLHSCYGFLRDIAPALVSGSFTPLGAGSWNNKLDDFEEQCAGIMAAVGRGIDEPRLALGAQQVKGFRPGRIVEEFEGHLSEFERRMQPYWMALYVRTLVAQLKCALPVNRVVTKTRLDALTAALEEGREQQGQFFTLAKNRAGSIDGRLTWARKDQEYQSRIKARLGDLESRMLSCVAQIQATRSAARRHVEDELAQVARPSRLAIEIGPDGTVLSVGRLPDGGEVATLNRSAIVVMDAPAAGSSAAKEHNFRGDTCSRCGVSRQVAEYFGRACDL